jgi:hypothetical protein
MAGPGHLWCFRRRKGLHMTHLTFRIIAPAQGGMACSCLSDCCLAVTGSIPRRGGAFARGGTGSGRADVAGFLDRHGKKRPSGAMATGVLQPTRRRTGTAGRPCCPPKQHDHNNVGLFVVSSAPSSQLSSGLDTWVGTKIQKTGGDTSGPFHFHAKSRLPWMLPESSAPDSPPRVLFCGLLFHQSPLSRKRSCRGFRFLAPTAGPGKRALLSADREQ